MVHALGRRRLLPDQVGSVAVPFWYWRRINKTRLTRIQLDHLIVMLVCIVRLITIISSSILLLLGLVCDDLRSTMWMMIIGMVLISGLSCQRLRPF